MSRLPRITAALLALAVSAVSVNAEAAFSSGMNQAQIQAEITGMLSQTNPATGKAYTLVEVGSAMKAAGYTAAVFTTDSILRGSGASAVVSAAITVWGTNSAPEIAGAAVAAAPTQAGSIVSEATGAAPTQVAAIQTAAINAGADPTVVLAASAAGGPAAGPIGGGPAGTPAPALGGGAGPGGGGGGGVASPA